MILSIAIRTGEDGVLDVGIGGAAPISVGAQPEAALAFHLAGVDAAHMSLANEALITLLRARELADPLGALASSAAVRVVDVTWSEGTFHHLGRAVVEFGGSQAVSIRRPLAGPRWRDHLLALALLRHAPTARQAVFVASSLLLLSGVGAVSPLPLRADALLARVLLGASTNPVDVAEWPVRIVDLAPTVDGPSDACGIARAILQCAQGRPDAIGVDLDVSALRQPAAAIVSAARRATDDGVPTVLGSYADPGALTTTNAWPCTEPAPSTSAEPVPIARLGFAYMVGRGGSPAGAARLERPWEPDLVGVTTPSLALALAQTLHQRPPWSSRDSRGQSAWVAFALPSPAARSSLYAYMETACRPTQAVLFTGRGWVALDAPLAPPGYPQDAWTTGTWGTIDVPSIELQAATLAALLSHTGGLVPLDAWVARAVAPGEPVRVTPWVTWLVDLAVIAAIGGTGGSPEQRRLRRIGVGAAWLGASAVLVWTSGILLPMTLPFVMLGLMLLRRQAAGR